MYSIQVYFSTMQELEEFVLKLKSTPSTEAPIPIPPPLPAPVEPPKAEQSQPVSPSPKPTEEQQYPEVLKELEDILQTDPNRDRILVAAKDFLRTVDHRPTANELTTFLKGIK